MTANQKRCFVISPIGIAGSEVRTHADDVFDYIISPAMGELGYFTHRGDHNSRPGKISDQMYDSILRDDLLIAVLTFANPNVYYELAIAHAAARPLVILCAADHALPFDIKDQRVIFYDLRPRSLIQGLFKEELKRAVAHLVRADEPPEVPFRPKLSPLGGLGESFRIFDRYIDTISQGALPLKLIGGAQKWIKLSGIALQALGLPSEFKPILQSACDRGVKISVVTMHESNPGLSSMLSTTIPDHIGKVREEIIRSRLWWRSIADELPNVAFRQVRQGIVYQQLFMNEHRMLYTPYSIVATTHYSPTIQSDHRSPLYTAQQKEFDFLWAASSPHDGAPKPVRTARRPNKGRRSGKKRAT